MQPNLLRVSQAPPPIPASAFDSRQPSDDLWKVEKPHPDDSKEKEVGTELRHRVTECLATDGEWLRNSDKELEFLSGRHWLEEETGVDRREDMISKGRSAFVFDLLTPSVELQVNQIRINKLTANFIPSGEGADNATADVMQGLYRNIERESKAQIARETAYQFAVSIGRGYWRVVIQDEPGATFGRRIGIQRIDNLHSVLIDPTGIDFTYSDAEWGYIFDDVWKGQFKAQYNRNDVPLDLNGLMLPETERNLWFPKDKVRVGEYWRRVWKSRTVWKLQDGTECWKEDAPRGSYPVREKEKLDFDIEWRRITGSQTLEKRVWPGRYIPIVVVIGREVFRGKAGKIHSGMVKPAMDASKAHDYMTSRVLDAAALSPLPHFSSFIGQLSPEQKNIVNNINSTPWSVVEQTPLEDKEGRQLPRGEWVSPVTNIQALTELAAMMKDNLMRILNTYAPQLGKEQADQSGKAIKEVKDAGDISHAAFPDNYNRALTQEAIIVNDLFPSVYSDKRAITITMPDEKTKQVLINQEYLDKKTGKTQHHMFGSNKYSVVTVIDISYPSQVRERIARLLDLSKQFPAQFATCVDLIVTDLGIPGVERYKERLRPPGFNDDEDGPSNMQLQQHILQMERDAQQAHQLIQMLLQKVNQLGSKEAIERLKIASNERIAAMNNQAAIIESEVKAGQDATHSVLMAELHAIIAAMENPPSVGEDQTSESAPASPAPAPAAPSVPAPAAPTPTGGPGPIAPPQVG